MRGSFQSLAQVSNLRGTAEKGHEQHPILFKKREVIKSSRKCLVMTWNVWSVLNASKLENLLQIMKDYNISIACISETWFDSQNGPFSKSIKDAGYKLHHANRDKKRGGGTAIIYKKNLMIKDGEASVTDFSSFF